MSSSWSLWRSLFGTIYPVGWQADPREFPRHVYMVIAEIVTLLLYAVSVVFLPEYFGRRSYSPSSDGRL